MRVNDNSRKWEKLFHSCVTLIAYISSNDQSISLILETKVKKTAAFCSTNGYCQIPVTFWATWRQNFDNFMSGTHSIYKYTFHPVNKWLMQISKPMHYWQIGLLSLHSEFALHHFKVETSIHVTGWDYCTINRYHAQTHISSGIWIYSSKMVDMNSKPDKIG